jgi:predicted RNA-binding Zn-ribbon protein involved in translation (DUF1610 family)
MEQQSKDNDSGTETQDNTVQVGRFLMPRRAVSEFICPGCGRPLQIALRSDMCFAEAQIYCDDCERDYREKRGRWGGET